MKHSILLVILSVIVLVSCKKTTSEVTPVSLNGKWKMVSVKDNQTNISTEKPSSVQGDVVITFTSIDQTSGTLSGNTPTNEISSSEYSINANHAISIPALFMTKVWETSWGSLFVNNIRTAQKYNFGNDGKLNIITADKTLIFQKL